jgi:CMP-N-acetylneuraminic acid synthetase
MTEQRTLHALVPMKGHSERIPEKNLKLFANEPLFYKIMRALQQAKSISQIYVDTDSEQIAELAQRDFGAQIIMRPAELCGDYVSMNDIIQYDISKIDGDHFLQTHSTNPLLTSSTIDKAAEMYFANLQTNDSVFSVTRYQTRFYDHQFKAVNHNPAELIRTQDLPPLFEENSNFYIFSRQSFAKRKQRIGNDPLLYEMDKIESIDIDYEIEFKLAELLYHINFAEKV